MSRAIRSDGRIWSLRGPGAFVAGLVALSLGAASGFMACNTESSGRAPRRWTRCTCSYISDFDEPGSASIDVCSDGRDIEEVAAACARNDGVGIPTGCHCDAASRGPCQKGDRCRQVSSAR